MIITEFGIIEEFDEKDDYTGYCPEKYHCVPIDDDTYLNDWWPLLLRLDTFNVYAKGVLQPQKALSRWGITIIPPRSLPGLLDIVVEDRRYKKDRHLAVLADVIRKAIRGGNYMIHFGV